MATGERFRSWRFSHMSCVLNLQNLLKGIKSFHYHPHLTFGHWSLSFHRDSKEWLSAYFNILFWIFGCLLTSSEERVYASIMDIKNHAGALKCFLVTQWSTFFFFFFFCSLLVCLHSEKFQSSRFFFWPCVFLFCFLPPMPNVCCWKTLLFYACLFLVCFCVLQLWKDTQDSCYCSSIQRPRVDQTASGYVYFKVRQQDKWKWVFVRMLS